MLDLSVTYMGLQLKNPIIIGSCGLTSTIDSLKKIETEGAAAVVLKSIFEEQILNQTNFEIQEVQKNSLLYSQMSESLDYIDQHIQDGEIQAYIQLVKQAKKELLIPVIASINCVSSYSWEGFAKQIEQAGADALELNVYMSAADESDESFEDMLLHIADTITKTVTIPVAIKISSAFTKLSKTIQALDKTAVQSIVLFNRFASPDFDLDTNKISYSHKYSSPQEHTIPLRWIALNGKKISTDLVASTGIHTGNAAVKQILAGAVAVQVVSALYLHGLGHIQTMLSEIEQYMKKHSYLAIDNFKGKLAIDEQKTAVFERIQFMKYFGQIG